MSLLVLEGFEGGGIGTIALNGSGAIVSDIVRGSWSAGALRCGSSQGIVYAWPNGASAQAFYFAFGFRHSGTGGETVMEFRSPTDTEQCRLTLTAGAVFQFQRGSTVLATGTTPTVANRWYHLQGYVYVADGTSGRVQLKLDGVDEIHNAGSYVTSIDTRQDATYDTVARNTFSRLGTSYWDDFIVHSAAGSAPFDTWPGDRGVIRCRLNAVGDTTQWVARGEGADTYDTEVLTNGVPAYASYRLDETSGTVADNAEGTAARDGTYEGSPTLGTASSRDRIRSGDKYVALDGVNDQVALPSDVLQLTTAASAWSAEMWVRIGTGTGNITAALFGGRSSTDTDPINSLYLFQQSDGQGNSLRWDTRGDNGIGLNQLRRTFGTNVAVDGFHDPRGCGHWHHIAVTRSTGGVKRIYWDGSEVINGTDALTSGTGALDRSDIGREEGNGTNVFGDVSEFHVYRGELSAAEVATHYGRSAYRYEQADDYQLENVWPNGATNTDGQDWQDFDQTYVWSATTNDVELFGIEDVPASYVAAYGVSLKAIVRKVDPGDRLVALVLKSGGTVNTSSDYGVSTSWGRVERLLEVDPTDSLAWSNAKVNALQIGVKAR